MKKIRKLAAVLSAAAIMTSGMAVLPASAEAPLEPAALSYTLGALSKPKIIKAAKTTDSVTLKWSKVKGATGYKVYKLVGKKYKTVKTITKGSTIKYKIKGLKSGKKYSFKVRAFKKKSGKTKWSKYSGAKVVYTKGDRKAAIAAYGEYLTRPSIKWAEDWSDSEYSTADMDFCLKDLNSDGVPELMLYNGRASHGEGYVKWMTYSDGEVKYLTTNEGASYYYPKSGVFMTAHMGMGILTEAIYKLYPDGKLKLLGTFVDESGAHKGGNGPKYGYWGKSKKKLSEKAFNTKLKKYTGSEKRKSRKGYKFYSNTEANRRAYLK